MLLERFWNFGRWDLDGRKYSVRALGRLWLTSVLLFIVCSKNNLPYTLVHTQSAMLFTQGLVTVG